MRKKCSHPDCDKWANLGIVRKAGAATFQYCTNKHAMHDYDRREAIAKKHGYPDRIAPHEETHETKLDDLGESPDF